MQKFHKNDWVYVAADLGPTMSHFASDCQAIVLGSYSDMFGGLNDDCYMLQVKYKGVTGWYHDHQLTLIEHSRPDLLEKWIFYRSKEQEIIEACRLGLLEIGIVI